MKFEEETVSLRDQMAMAALSGMLSNDFCTFPLNSQKSKKLAKTAYLLADDMMKESIKSQEFIEMEEE